MKKASISIEFLIKLILGFLVLVAVIFFFTGGYTKLINFGGLEWNDLSLTEQGKVNSNFNNLVYLLKGCSEKLNCLCGSEEGFPFSFRDEQILVVNNTADGKSNLTLMHRNVVVGSAIIPNQISLEERNLLESETKNFIVSFKDGIYYLGSSKNKGLTDRAAFIKSGKVFYLLSEKTPSTSATLRFSNNFTVC